MKEVVALQRSVQDVTGQLDDSFVSVCGLQKPDEECVCRGDRDVVLESFQDPFFHVDDLD